MKRPILSTIVVFVLCILIGCSNILPKDKPGDTTAATPAADTPPSSGGAACEVPDVVGQEQAIAENMVTTVGLRVVKNVQFDPDVPAGAVIAQEPAPGALMDPCQGDVALTISMGADPQAATPTAETEAPTSTPQSVASNTSPPATPSGPAAPLAQGQRLQTIKDRGNLICGVNGTLPGFSKQASDGSYSGFDVDFCRAVAVALFNDPQAVEFVNLSASERFSALQEGRVDVLFRNTTWTAERDTAFNLDFGPVIFHDGQGFMVRKDLYITTLQELSNSRICVRAGTTHETNLPNKFATLGITFEPVTFEDENAAYAAYDAGECEAITGDRSALAAKRTTLQNPGDHSVLDEMISREPLGPGYLEDDSSWGDIVRLVSYAVIYAEELGINSANAEEKQNVPDRQTRRLLGAEGEVGSNLGLSNDFALNVLQQIGNYGEIYNRHLGPDTPINLDRGPNKAWNIEEGDGIGGGLLWSPTW